MVLFQGAKKMLELGITGPEGHEMCRPEEVSVLRLIICYIGYQTVNCKYVGCR